jgi:WD40 repeat protein
MDSRQERFTLPKIFSGAVNALTFSADGETLAAIGNDTRIALWDVASGNVKTNPYRARGIDRRSQLWSEAGTMASVEMNGRVIVWDLATGQARSMPGTLIVKLALVGLKRAAVRL